MNHALWLACRNLGLVLMLVGFVTSVGVFCVGLVLLHAALLTPRR